MVLKSTVAALLFVLPAAVITVAAAGQPSAKPAASGPRVVATTLQLMRGPIKSTSDDVFKAAGEPPTSADAWTAAQLQALTLAETGNLLMIGSRAVDKTEWMKMARAMVDAAADAAAAAAKKNAETFATAGDTLYETCESCHAKYMKK
jgi:hypothetical protein